MVRTSSSVTRLVFSFDTPSSASTSWPDLSKSQITGEVIWATTAMIGAAIIATPSGFFRAICFGTSSPTISDR